MLSVSAIICTHNRASYLAKALDSLERQSLSKSRYEVLLVDNCSSDGTRDLVVRRMSQISNLRYLFEAELGLSAARNRGLTEATGTLVAFLDDDAIADQDWLEWAVRVFEERSEDLGFVGGKVRPIWEAERPEWLSDNLLPFLSMTDLGDAPVEVDGPSGLVGANMIFRTQVLRDAGGFPTSLGRRGEKLLSNEEIQLKRRLESKGLVSLYHPRVCVSHHAVASRLTKQWYRHRLYWQGRSDAVLWRGDTSPSDGQRRLRILRASVSISKPVLFWILHKATSGDQALAFTKECRFYHHCGYLAGLIAKDGW